MGFVREHRAATAVAVAVALVASVLVVLALRADGYVTRRVALNDGGVWVTSDAEGLFGRLNKPAGALDLALNPPGGVQAAYRLDVRQSGAAVAAWDQGSGRLIPVDVASGRADADQAVPVSADEQVELAGGTIAVLDTGANKVWAERVAGLTSIPSLASLDPTAKPVVALPKASGVRSAALAVGTDGTVHIATSQGTVEAARPTGDGFARPVVSQLEARLDSVQVSAVGSQVVVFDARQGRVFLPGGRRVDVPVDADAQVQVPSGPGTDVVIASRTALYAVPLAGGTVRTLFSGAGGRPARPTWLGSCVHAAWAGTPGIYARACDGAAARRVLLPGKGLLSEPVFRVNRASILLNDLALGSVYDLDSLQEVDNWSAVRPPPLVRSSTKNRQNTSSVATREQPPKAVDDTWGARPGRTTVLHVLDNDSDPQGAILSISRLGAPSVPGAQVAVAPDGQSVEIALPAQGARDVQFKYTIDDGKGLTAQANVNVEVRGPGDEERPRLRQGFAQPSFTVIAGGTLDLPVLDDWRDFDGDPLVISAARVDAGGRGAGGSVTTSPSGRLDFVAPGTGGSESIVYTVSDGTSAGVEQRVPVTVLAPSSNRTAPPVANADIARGQVGKPITITPLANDLPGADPTNPDAELALAGQVAAPAGITVTTDLKSGTVTAVGSRAGTFLLSYTASFGNAKFGHAAIRVDVAAPPPSALPPVAVPDTGVLFGQTAATIDVLANDFDPAGGVLVVQHAAADDAAQVAVSIVGGRFLRLQSRVPDVAPNPQVVQYSITDGLTAPVDGGLTVIQRPAPAQDTPLAVDDYATVRGGDSVLAPVLDNDVDPAGATLALLDNVPGAPAPGRLTVTSDGARLPDVGAAFVAGAQVRYTAPVVTQPTAVTVAYVARNPTGARAAGLLHVTITPPPSVRNPDQAPAAVPLSARVVAGQTIRISVPTTGVDPDGDTANVVGIASAPTLGRITSIGSTSISYEAFPTLSGTDRFTYLLADPFGRTSSASISIGVAQVSDPQPPAAVDDTVTAPPGAKVRVDALANDVIAPDDAVSIGNLRASNPELAAPVRLIAPGGPIQVTAPARDGDSVAVQYSVSDGSGQPSVATITVRAQARYVPPPTVVDVPATPTPGAASVTVDVLRKVTDPENLPVHVAHVFDPQAVTTAASGTVTVPVLSRVQNVVFEVANSRGGTAAAVIHVPARAAGIPQVKANQLITVGRDRSRTVDLAQYVLDPADLAVRLTTTDTLHTAPADGLKLTSPDPTHLTLTGVNGYDGPAAISFQVTDGKTLNDPNGHLAVITVQVQVGPDIPVIRCPSAALAVVEGGPDLRLDVAALCHVWLADRSQLPTLDYTATWSGTAPTGISILGNGSHVIGLRAGGSAVPGRQGTLTVGVKGTRATPSTLHVGILKLGQAAMAPISIDNVKAGATATRDVRGSVTSPLRDPRVSVVRIEQATGMPARVTKSGPQVGITPGAASHGTMTFQLVLTDVADVSRQDRWFRGRITLNVLNVPDAPGASQAGRTVLSQTVVLSWPTPADNGAPIDRYEVDWSGGAQTCAASPCRIVNLRNGTRYPFTVRAHNGVGFSRPSPALAPPARPDKLPAAVTALGTGNPQDHALTVTWQSVANGGTAPTGYRISWSGGGAASAGAGQRSVTARGLDNHNVYTFTVVAVNALGAGPPASVQGQSAGLPTTPANVAVNYASEAGTTQRAVTVTWSGSDPNGAGPSTYTVTRDGVVVCRNVTATSCNDLPATAHTYTYAVVAANVAGHASAPGSTRFSVAGTPDAPTQVVAAPTQRDGELTVSYTVPDSHGTSSRVQCRDNLGYCGQWTPGGPPGSTDTQTITGLQGDVDVTLTLTDCNEQNRCGPGADSNTTHTNSTPHGVTGLSCSVSNHSTITWRWDRPDAINGHTITRYTTNLDGTANGSQAGTTFTKTFVQDGGTHDLTVTSVDDRGESSTGAPAAGCAVDPAPPPPNPETITISMGAYTQGSASTGSCTAGCHFIVVTLRNFAANTTYQVHLDDSPGSFNRTYPFTTDASGNMGPKQSYGYYGGPNGGGFGGINASTDNGKATTRCYGNWQKGTGCQ